METIKFEAPFIASEQSFQEGLSKMLLKGVLIDTSQNLNKWMVEEEDFKQLAKDFLGKQIRVDHSEKVSEVIGVVTGTEVDKGHNIDKADWDPANPNTHIHYVAELATKDDKIIVPVKMGFVNRCSPAVDAKTVLCNICKTPTQNNVKMCECNDSGVLLKDIIPRELSLVASPAYAKTVAKVYSFAASVDKQLNNIKEGEQMADDVKKEVPTEVEDRMKKLEAAVVALASRFKAEEEEYAEEMKAEEEEKVHMAEEEEEPKKTVPITRVAEEEKDEKEEKEEEKKEIAKLVAQVQKLKAAIAAFKADDGKVTPETPEDEPDWKVVKPPQISNEPVKSTKTDKIFQTPSMKPGAIKAGGKSAGVVAPSFSGQRTSKEEVQMMALDEVFGFAASRGVTPMKVDYKVQTVRV